MPIVFACAASHAPGMTAWTEAAPQEQRDKILGSYHKLGDMLAASKPVEKKPIPCRAHSAMMRS